MVDAKRRAVRAVADEAFSPNTTIQVLCERFHVDTCRGSDSPKVEYDGPDFAGDLLGRVVVTTSVQSSMTQVRCRQEEFPQRTCCGWNRRARSVSYL